MHRDGVADNQKVYRENGRKGKLPGARWWIDLYLIMNILHWKSNVIGTMCIS